MTFDRDAYEVLEVHPKAHQQVIQAAYRVLAAIYHPDRDPTATATRRMAELNSAYAKVRTADLRQLYDRARKLQSPAAAIVTPYPSSQPPATDGGGASRLDFGRYEGWTVGQIARQDPDYLRWLSRHSSGARFRGEIDAALRKLPRRPSDLPPGEREGTY